METSEDELWGKMERDSTIDYLQGSVPGENTNGGNLTSAEEQARVKCEGLRHSTEQLEKHKKIFLQVEETHQAIVRTLPKDEEYNAIFSKKYKNYRHPLRHAKYRKKVENPMCINCNELEHTAAWKGCSKYPHVKNTTNDNSARTKTTFTSNKVNEKFSFANIVTRNNNNAIQNSVNPKTSSNILL
ncbi:hypothetical protein CEXT_329481 [Caerostris extrusa]|uniref:Uncharacterized protein n=1 Tax=Caerostris extrusa TaxID=172846 RepID=A0AAV4SVD5_CAEEX|nr:hypothetical protein CEXT_329481 [Caerostris extrusa]